MLVDVLRALFEDGRVRFAADAVASAAEIDEAVRFVERFETEWQRALPGRPPAVSLPALRWSVVAFHQALRLAAYRYLDVEEEFRTLQAQGDDSGTPAECYSVDLLFRFLPDLIRLTRSASVNDPLTTRLLEWAGRWPLSSVGVEGVAVQSVAGFLDHHCLKTLYVDRILAAGDVSRLADPRVREAVRAALGAHPELAPRMVAALSPVEESHA